MGDLGEPVLPAEPEAVAVGDLRPADQLARSGHPPVGLRGHRFAGHQRPLPGQQVADAGAQRAGGVGQPHADRLVVLETALAVRFVARRPVGDDRGVVQVAGPFEAERSEEALFQEPGVGRPGPLLDEDAEQVVAGVVVLVAVAGLELEGGAAEEGRHRLVVEVEPRLRPELLHLGVALDPGGVVQQALDRDGEAVGVVVREVVAEVGVEVEAAVLDEGHRCGGGELLGHRADPVHGVGGGRDAVLEVGEAESLGEDGLAAAGDADGEAGGRVRAERFGGERADRLGGAVGRGGGFAAGAREPRRQEEEREERGLPPRSGGGHARIVGCRRAARRRRRAPGQRGSAGGAETAAAVRGPQPPAGRRSNSVSSWRKSALRRGKPARGPAPPPPARERSGSSASRRRP